jgi:hypothetical protein
MTGHHDESVLGKVLHRLSWQGSAIVSGFVSSLANASRFDFLSANVSRIIFHHYLTSFCTWKHSFLSADHGCSGYQHICFSTGDVRTVFCQQLSTK